MRLLALPSLLLLISKWVSASSHDAQQSILDSHESSFTSPLAKLHRALVEHESIIGTEQAVTKYLVSYLKQQNFTVETQDVGPAASSAGPRQNVFAFIGETRETRTLVTSVCFSHKGVTRFLFCSRL